MTRPQEFCLIPEDVDDKNGGIIHVERPIVTVLLENKEKHRDRRNVDCLLDSGSHTNLFPAYLAEALRIDLKSVKGREIFGIGTSKVWGYRHKVTMKVGLVGLSTTFETEIDFSEQMNFALLGLNGFHDKFSQIIYLTESKRLMLIPKDLS